MTWTRPAGAALAGIAIACTLDTSLTSCSTSTACAPISITSHLIASVAIVVAGVALLVTFAAVVFALRTTRSAMRALADLALPPPAMLRQVARPLALPPVFCLASDVPSALCAGGLHPRIYVSTGLLDRLAGDELRAVLIHEASHARRRDPIRRQLRRSLAAVLFFMPVVGSWAQRAAIADELSADRDVLEACGPEPLARALLATSPLHAPSAAALDGAASLRVAHLLGAPVVLPVPRLRDWALSAAGAVVAALALLCISAAVG